MLVLSRKNGQSVWMHIPMPDGSVKKIKVSVVETKGHTNRLGFVAPKDVLIYRDDLTDENGDPVAQVPSGAPV